MDFDDLLCKCLEAFIQNPYLLKKCQKTSGLPGTEMVMSLLILHPTNKQNFNTWLLRSLICTQKGSPLPSIAVLSRTNQELEDVAAELENRHLEYCSNEPIKDIYEHFIFKDLIAYLNLADGVFRPEYLLRILNRPNRYLMESAFKHIREFTKTALTDAVSSYPSHYRSAPDKAAKLYSEIYRLRGKNLYEKVADIADQIGYRKYLTEYSEFTGQHKDVLWEKLDYFIADSKRYSDCNAWYSAAIPHIRLHHAKKEKQTNKGIVLSTMHRSKGLEWDTVFIINCCEGYTPISKAEKVSELEEERRLFYVAMTRAREKLYLLNHASNPGAGKAKSQVKPSLFLSEINGTEPKRNTRNDVLTQKQDMRKKEIENEFEEETLSNLQEGMEIHHKTYGIGLVIKKTLAYVIVRFKTNDKIFFV